MNDGMWETSGTSVEAPVNVIEDRLYSKDWVSVAQAAIGFVSSALIFAVWIEADQHIARSLLTLAFSIVAFIGSVALCYPPYPHAILTPAQLIFNHVLYGVTVRTEDFEEVSKFGRAPFATHVLVYRDGPKLKRMTIPRLTCHGAILRHDLRDWIAERSDPFRTD